MLQLSQSCIRVRTNLTDLLVHSSCITSCSLLTCSSPATAPYCGYYAFVFDVDYTYWNFGCSTLPYSLFVDLIPTTTDGSTSTDVVLNGGGSSSITATASTIFIVSQSTDNTQTNTPTIFVAPGASIVTSASTGSSSTSVPNIGSHSKSSTPIGAIVGGVIGGIAVIAFLAFLLWFFLRKRKQDKRAAQAHEAQVQAGQANAAAAATATAFHNHNRISEIGGAMKPPPTTTTYVPPPGVAGVFGEKPSATENTQEIYRPPPDHEQNQSAYADTLNAGAQSPPPPVYSRPTATPTSPHSHHNELEQQNTGVARPASVPPVSPMLTGTTSQGQNQSQGLSPVGTPSPGQQYQHMSVVSNMTAIPMTAEPLRPELAGSNTQLQHQSQSQHQQSYSPRPGFQEMSGVNMAGVQRPPGPPPQGIQEMNASVVQKPMGPPPGMQEMSASTGVAASGGVNRPPGPPGPPQGHYVDMSGAPMSEEFHSAELEG